MRITNLTDSQGSTANESLWRLSHRRCDVRRLLLVGVLAGSARSATAQQSPNTTDGRITSGEFSSASAVSAPTAWGTLYARTESDSLIIAVDYTVDVVDDGPSDGDVRHPGDYVRLNVDVDGDGTFGEGDFEFSPVPGSFAALRRLRFPSKPWENYVPQPTRARFAAGFAGTGDQVLPHRIWEFRIPWKELSDQPDKVVGLSVNLNSTNPARTGPIPNAGVLRVRRTEAAVDPQVLTIQNSGIASAQADSVSISIDSSGALLFTYADGRVRRVEPSGEETVTYKNGAVQKSAAIEAARATPPAPPSEAAVATWITQSADDLLQTLKVLLRDDPASFARYKASEGTLSLYGKVDRRIRAIYYILNGR